MQDRPTYDELLAAIERFLDEEIVPNTPGGRAFHARVAANAIRTVRRELAAQDDVLAAAWGGLDALLGATERPAGRAALRKAIVERNAELCELIRGGDADAEPFAEQVREHLRNTVRDKLRVSNPRWLGETRDTTH
jgi:hypothetical protein